MRRDGKKKGSGTELVRTLALAHGAKYLVRINGNKAGDDQ